MTSTDRYALVLDAEPSRRDALLAYLNHFLNVLPFTEDPVLIADAQCLLLAANVADALNVFHEARRRNKRMAVLVYGIRQHCEAAIELLGAGADEFVMQQHERDFAVLPTAINRAVQARERQMALEQARSEALHHALTLATILNHVNDAVISFGESGHIQLFNKQAEHLFGYRFNDVINQSVLLLIPLHLRDEAWRLFSDAQKTDFCTTTEFLAQRLDGEVFPVEFSCRCIRLSGKDQFVVTLRDISSRKEMEAALHFHIALEGFISSVATDLINRPTPHISAAIDGALSTMGLMCNLHRCYVLLESPDTRNLSCTNEWNATGISSLRERWQQMSKEMAPLFERRLSNSENIVVNDVDAMNDSIEKAQLRKRGVKTLLLLPLRMDERVKGVLGLESTAAARQWTDVEISLLSLIAAVFANAFARQRRELALEALSSELADANVRLHQQARRDSLTGIHNRRHFDEVLEQEYRRALRDRKPLAVLICDVDFFKPYNDLYGHPAGDACLVKVALVLTESFQRSGDLCARYGGEEFVVLMAGLSGEQALQAAERARRLLADAALPHARGVNSIVTASFGLASMSPDSPIPVKELLQAADQGLYRSKESGRNRCTLIPLTKDDQPATGVAI